MEKIGGMNYSFHPEAEAELIYAVNYYETCEGGLGYDFAVEVYVAVQRILANPKAWQFIEENIRRSLVNRFPYGVLYAEDKNEIYILAIMHLHRNPDYWKQRM